MMFFAQFFFLIGMFVITECYAEQRIVIWDYDGTIAEKQNLLPNVENVMLQKDTLNIICSGIRSLEPNAFLSKKLKLYNPEPALKKFKQLMTQLPIKAVVFSYALGGTECWVLIKTDTDIEVRKAHEDTRYLHLKGYFQKPDTGMFQVIKDIMHELHSKTDDLLFIGDTLQDQQAAQAFGIAFKHAHEIHTQNL